MCWTHHKTVKVYGAYWEPNLNKMLQLDFNYVDWLNYVAYVMWMKVVFFYGVRRKRSGNISFECVVPILEGTTGPLTPNDGHNIVVRDIAAIIVVVENACSFIGQQTFLMELV